MTKLIVQIPCLNEEETLPATVRDIPRQIEGVDQVEILVIDDGSTDRTREVAREIGVEHIVGFPRHKGLTKAFTAGIDACLKLGADIIVNTDGDNQYKGSDIPKLIRPILEGNAEMVVGDRQVDTIAEFSPLKKRLQKLGSWVVRKAANAYVSDTTSGFRAYSREAALNMNVLSWFSYTLETIIQAGSKDIAIANVSVGTNRKLRESRLFGGMGFYLRRSFATIVRIYAMYQPLRVFFYTGTLMLSLGFLIGLRFLYFYLTTGGTGHIQSLILASILLIVGFQIVMIGLLADVIAANRKLIEDVLTRVRRMEISSEKRL